MTSRASRPSGSAVSQPDFITLGYAEPEARSKTRDRMVEFARRLGVLVDIDVGVAPLPSYDRVAQLVHHSEIDLAWLSPIPMVSLARNRRVVPLVSFHRDAFLHYRCAIIVSSASRIFSLGALRGKRAAWVDAHSASGFVMPRIELAAHSVDLRRFGEQRFFGSHDAVVRAVASGRADFGCTFARVSRDGEMVGAWTRTPGLASSVRVLWTFGEVPPDALVARFDLDRALRERIVRVMLAMTKRPADHGMLADVFGADDLQIPKRALYEPLRHAVIEAYQAGLLDTSGIGNEEQSAAGTIERRAILVPIDPPTVPRLRPFQRSQPLRRSRADDTQEAEIVEVIEDRGAQRSDPRRSLSGARGAELPVVIDARKRPPRAR